MKTNVGSIDRVARITVGAGLIVATLLEQIGPWGWIGAIPLATGLFRFCPAYCRLAFALAKHATKVVLDVHRERKT